MIHLDVKIKGLCQQLCLALQPFLLEYGVDHIEELAIKDLEDICRRYQFDLYRLIFKPTTSKLLLSKKINKIRLLVLDVDGVLTDGGMYVTESGDQFKRFNTKDGMAILHLTKSNFQVAIISSGFKAEAVTQRAQLLGIQHCYVGRRPKLEVLNEICTQLGIGLDQVAMVGDDINDLPVMREIGLTFCPQDAVPVVRQQVDVILSLNGGAGCVRELIDGYLLDAPISR